MEFTPTHNRIVLVLVMMILLHFIADYTLQGWLAQGKQKTYWQPYDKKYKYDYVPALICHSLYWSILITAPILYYSWSYMNWYWIVIPVNAILHYIIDDLKANKLKINLITDQLLHLIQIVLTWVGWLVFLGVY